MTGNFEDSYLGNIIGVQRQKMKDFTNSGLKMELEINLMVVLICLQMHLTI